MADLKISELDLSQILQDDDLFVIARTEAGSPSVKVNKSVTVATLRQGIGVSGGDGDIQFNNNGEQAGDSNFQWNSSESILNIGGSSGMLNFGGTGLGAPTYGTRSDGTRIIIQTDGITSGQLDNAIGVEDGAMWFSSEVENGHGFNFYAGDKDILRATGYLASGNCGLSLQIKEVQDTAMDNPNSGYVKLFVHQDDLKMKLSDGTIITFASLIDVEGGDLHEVLTRGNETLGEKIVISNYATSFIEYSRGAGGKLDANSTSEYRTWVLPDETGTIALKEHIDLYSVLIHGNSTGGVPISFKNGGVLYFGASEQHVIYDSSGNLNIIAGTGGSLDLVGNTGINLSSAHVQINSSEINLNASVLISSNSLNLSSNGNVGGIHAASLSDDKSWIFPDSSGTVALTSDIVSTFLGLTDTPSSLSGEAGNALRVNSGETGVEFYTQKNEKSITIENPLATDDFILWVPDADITITKVYFKTDQGTVDFNINHSNGPDLWSTDTQAGSTLGNSTTFNDATVGAGNPVSFQASAVASSPGKVHVTIEYTFDN